ncbi:MAG: radical SAM protein [Elusimicrobiota bacterium]
MKVSLIHPPFTNSIKTTKPRFVDENEGFFPPLGLMYIATYLKIHMPFCKVQVIDANLERLDHAQIAKKAVAYGSDVVGISCWTFSLLDTYYIAKEVKKLSPKTLVVFGGPHISIYPVETLSNEFVDFVVANDGEKAFHELLLEIEGKHDYGNVSNLHYKSNGSVVKSAKEHSENDLDSIPIPERDWTDYKKYYSFIDQINPITTMITSRGCPFKCNFCFKQNSGWRYRGVQNILAEIEYCLSLGIKNFFFWDETFTVNKKRTIEFCKQVLEKKLDIVWSCRSRIDTMDEETLSYMKQAHCLRISFGVESANPHIQKLLNKQVPIPRVIEIFKLMKKLNMISLADFMTGCPDETRKEAFETIDLACELDTEFVQFSLFTLYPCTTLYAEALEKKVVPYDVWHEYAKNPSVDFKPPLWNIFSESEVYEILMTAYRKFYLRPSYIIKKIIRVKSAAELLMYVKAGISFIVSLLRKENK